MAIAAAATLHATPITMAPVGAGAGADANRVVGGSGGKRGAEEEEQRLPMPSRNPLPLSASQEAQVREVFNARVRAHCADELKGSFSFILLFLSLSHTHSLSTIPFIHSTKSETRNINLKQKPIAFSDCARNRTFSTPFVCRALSHAMNSCMQAHATPAEHDRAREDWFAARMTRARERERRERRKLEQERFHREWWGLPERDFEHDLEKLERPERVGGVVRRRESQGQGQAQSNPNPNSNPPPSNTNSHPQPDPSSRGDGNAGRR
ncbi:hypothetical protein F5B17DRAFT_382204 [Nemania serpens]|nr:hypothetical protein F5B17DRAFT_382204 [Nemania serpens]